MVQFESGGAPEYFFQMNLSLVECSSIFQPMNEPTKKADPPAHEKLLAAVSGDVPEIYANGFSIGLSNADVVLVLARSNRPIQTVHMSFTLAKTLHLKLADVVKQFEDAVEEKMLTTDDVDRLLKKTAQR